MLAMAAFAGLAMEGRAQSSEIMKVRFDRSFAVAQNWLPAGEYNIRTVDTGGDSPVLLIESSYGSVLVTANRYEDRAREVVTKPEAIFEVENNKYYLRRIRAAGRSYGFEIIGTPTVQAD